MAFTPDPPGHGGPAAGVGGPGEYAVGAVIREGWGGTIREGQYLRTGRRVTVQDVRPDLAATPGLIERLSDIGRRTATIRDPHLLAVYDLVDQAAGLRLVGEWGAGRTVTDALRGGSMAPAQAVAIVHDVLMGLETLHGHGLFHGQVGPETVVMDAAGGRSRLAELALCAAAAPPGFGPHTDVRDTARLGLHLLRKGGSRYDPIRGVLDSAASTAGVTTAAELRAHLDGAAERVLGPGWRDRVGSPPRRRGERGRRGRRRLLLLLVAALIVAAVVAAVVLLAGRGGRSSSGPLTLDGDAKLVVSPAAGACNTTFTFVGTGSLSGTGTLVYRWEQSDGQVTANTSLPITPDEATFRLTQAWRLQGSQKVDGTMTLHIIGPVARQLSQTFHYACP